jgi:tetratricopeptide (TPR) repeat protein
MWDGKVGTLCGMFLQAEADFYLAEVKSEQGQWSEAVEFYGRSWEVNPGRVDCCVGWARALGKLGRWSEVVELYRQGVILFEEFGELWFGLGQALGELGRWEEAVVEYGRAVSLGFAGAEVRYYLGFALGELGRWEEAKIELRKAVELYLLGAADQNNNQLPKAEAFFRKTQSIRNLIATKTVEIFWGPVIRRSPESHNDQTVDGQKQNSINKIVIYTCVWPISELTRIVLSYYSGLKKELSGKIQLELLAVGSEGDASRKLCEDCGFDYFEYANQTLSAKWEYGINRCADYDPDGVIIVGSDDLISQNLIEFYDNQLKDNMVFCGLKDRYFFDVSKENLILWTGYNLQDDPTRVGETIGMGKCLSRFLLDKLGFSIWKGLDIHRGLDGAMTQQLFRLGLEILDYHNCVVAKFDNQEVRIGHCGFEMAEIGVCAVDIKFAENLTTTERYIDGNVSALVVQEKPWVVLNKYFPPEIIEQLKRLLPVVKPQLMNTHSKKASTKLEGQIKTKASGTIGVKNKEKIFEQAQTQKKLLGKDLASIFSWHHSTMTPGIKDWEKKWNNNPGKRILYFTPVDYSGSFYKWATAVNRFTEYAVRLVTLQFHEFGYPQDLVLPVSHQCEQSLRLMVGEADAVHIKDELGFFEEGKARNELPLDIFTTSSKPLIYTLYGGKARRFCHDYYYRDHVNCFNVAVAMTPDIAYPWIENLYFVPHSVDVDAFQYDWHDGKMISHSPSSPSRKGTELFLQAIEKLDPSLEVELNLIQGVSHAECIARKRKSTLFFDQAGQQKSNFPGRSLVIGWYGNSALEAMVHGIPTLAHLDATALDNAQRLGVDMHKRCPILNVPMIYGNGGVEGMIEKVESFFRLSEDERKKLSLKTRKWVEEFHSYDVNGQQLAGIYRRLLSPVNKVKNV